MKIVAISDLHGYLPKDLPEGDTLCICGDIFPLQIQSSIADCEYWLKKHFIPWTEELPYKEIVLTAGNHDFYFEKTSFKDLFLLFDNTKINYLEDSSVIIKGIKFYGTPWCHQFFNWAFMLSDEELTEKFSSIPFDVDILLTHDAPFGVSDVCLQWNKKEHIGNSPLTSAILDKEPSINIHGHLHSSDHNVQLLGNTKVYNVSLLDENYKNVYQPLVFEYEVV